ncbi:MAG: segregation/condensation protein A [Anaerolineaceae bacterium]|nr:segregation/condensation protein A [Anaerolineaceae bacterium]
MSFDVVAHQTEKYRVATAVYEGPLDLLLQLIEHAELDITTLALAQVTDQYLAYLANLQDHDPAEVSAFLVIAAKLLQIKSSALLPRPPLVDSSAEEEEPAEALARQLIQYRRFKQLAGILGQREEEGLRTYLRVAPPAIKVEAKLDLSGVTLADLIEAAKTMLLRPNDLKDLSTVVTLPRITIREKITMIVEALRESGAASFRALLHSGNRLEAVVTFLAMLELIKRNMIQAQQPGLFDDIQLAPVSELREIIEEELEFGD